MQKQPTMNKTTPVLHREEPVPFMGIKCLDSKQAKTFLNNVTKEINDTIDESCTASSIQTNSKTDCLFTYANGARVRIIAEFPELNRQEVSV